VKKFIDCERVRILPDWSHWLLIGVGIIFVTYPEKSDTVH
jgi:hypothetical protein